MQKGSAGMGTKQRQADTEMPKAHRVMEGLVKAHPEPGAVEIDIAARPEPGPNDILIRVLACGICGTDVHIYNWDPSISEMMDPPIVFGHEFCGTVEELGSEVDGTRVARGDYVSAEMHVVCGFCRECRTGKKHVCRNTHILGIHENGCFAEYVLVPASNVIKLPTSIQPKIGAFLDALGNAVHTACVTDVTGKRVAVLGYGSIGAMAASIVHFAGASSLHITELRPYNLGRAREWRDSLRRNGCGGAEIEILDVGQTDDDVVERVLDETKGGVDIVLEMSGASRAINDGFRMVRPGGEVALLGLPSKHDITLEHYDRDLIFKGLTVHGIIGRRMFETWNKMLDLLVAGLDVSHVVTHEFALADFQQAFDTIRNGDALKVVLYPDSERRTLDA